MKKKFEKPEVEVTKLEATDIIAASGKMAEGTVKGTAAFSQKGGMAGGTVGGISIFE